jgi:hypothetical protein
MLGFSHLCHARWLDPASGQEKAKRALPAGRRGPSACARVRPR